MGCAASVDKENVTIPITAEDDVGDEVPAFDFELGFSHRACNAFAANNNAVVRTPSQAAIAEREESDEFRVLRVSSLSGHVTLYVAGGKHKKPVQYNADRVCPRANEQPSHYENCPFCVGNEAKTPIDVLTVDMEGNFVEPSRGKPQQDLSGKWLLRVFPNIFPMLIVPTGVYGSAHHDRLDQIPHSAVARGLHSNEKVSMTDEENPIYTQVDAKGISEVFVENPMHNGLLALEEPSQIELLLKALVNRGLAISKEPFAKQLLIFKQYGPLSGGSLVHPHTQMCSLPTVPPIMQSRIDYGLHTYNEHGRCAVCSANVDPFINGKVIDGDESVSPSGKGLGRLVHVSDHFVVSTPYASTAQYSMTVVPRRHCSSFLEITPEEISDLAFVMALLSQSIYYGLDDPSYNIFIRTAPCASQMVMHDQTISREDIEKSFHWVMEMRPRFPADVGGFEIASGIRVVSGLPEDHAKDMRQWVKERMMCGVTPVRPAAETFKNKRNSMKRASIKRSTTADVDVKRDRSTDRGG